MIFLLCISLKAARRNFLDLMLPSLEFTEADPLLGPVLQGGSPGAKVTLTLACFSFFTRRAYKAGRVTLALE